MVAYRVCQPCLRLSMTRKQGICTLYPLSSESYKLTTNRHFSGFSRAGRTDANEAWHDKYYVLFDLARPPQRTDWVKDTTEWTW